MYTGYFSWLYICIKGFLNSFKKKQSKELNWLWNVSNYLLQVMDFGPKSLKNS